MLAHRAVKFLVFLLACQSVFSYGYVHVSHEKQLIRDLIGNYSEMGTNGRPVRGPDDTITVLYGMSLIQVLDLDEKNQILSTSVWATYRWNDMYMRWNESEYCNISTVRVSSDDIWKPDIKLYNYADTRLEVRKEADCVISSNGDVVWTYQATFMSSCSVDIRYFPFDEQRCNLKFGSWTYDGTKVDLQFIDADIMGFKMDQYIASNEWDIINTTGFRNVKYYPCCPQPYIDLDFELAIRRNAPFYKYILILPSVLLTILTLVIFWLSPESPTKIQFGMNIFVAFFILLLLLVDLTPPAADSIPLIGAYYCLNMILITLSTLLSVVIVNLYFHGPATKVPRLFRQLMLDYFAKVFFMTNSLMDKQEQEDRRKSIKFHDSEQPFPSAMRQPYQVSSISFFKTNDKRHVQFKYDSIDSLQTESETLGSSNDGLGNGSDSTDPILLVPSQHSNPLLSVQSNLSNPLLPVPGQILDHMHPLQFHYTQLEMEVKEIKKLLKIMTDISVEKARKEYLAREWKLVALVLDRLFFFLYLLSIIVSTLTLFEIQLFNR